MDIILFDYIQEKKDLGEIQCMHHACHTLTEFRIPWGRYLFRVPAAPENFLSAKDKFLTSGALRKYRLARFEASKV